MVEKLTSPLRNKPMVIALRGPAQGAALASSLPARHVGQRKS